MESLALYLPAIAAPIVALAGYAIARFSRKRMLERVERAYVPTVHTDEQVRSRLSEIMKAESALAEALKQAAARIEHAAVAANPRVMERL
jgi:hypothetical protein